MLMIMIAEVLDHIKAAYMNVNGCSFALKILTSLLKPDWGIVNVFISLIHCNLLLLF